LKRVLITGAFGQDGVILSRLYQKKNYKVFGFVKKKPKKGLKKVTYKINNLKSKNKIKNHLQVIKPNIVVHLASTNNNFLKRKNKKNYNMNYLQNLKSTKNLLNSIVENELKTKFIFAGSSLMFKNNLKKKVTEKDHLKSSEHYGQYKIDSHKFILSLKKKNKINASTVILFNHDSAYRNKKFLIPKLVESFENKNFNFIEKIYKLNISGDFSHAEDICNGIYKLSISKINIDKIILSSNKRFYINKIIIYLEKYYNLKIKRKTLKNNINFKLIGSNKLAKKILNYKVRKNPIDACKDIVKNYL
tara:strand:- start:651 stop:1562 length:912 start_codon:yes stop_codon:yes gene_type:complete